ncbi:TetR/AcrR family transcriptional regulator [Gottfriedia sp. NPDC056225]|uniref:TetR/AcrR family transcriptional regulator n=1 Tax=Gottfriedia sp. NPDC056225 TaxID=3345751 RepID=UPI0035D62B94
MDRRIIKTKKLIKEALFKYAVVKGIENVTVQDIIKEADINRATFYYHYKDKFELHKEIVDETLEGLVNDLVIPYRVQSFADIIYPPVLAVFEHVKKHAKVYKILLSKNGLPELRWKMLDVLKHSIQNNIAQLKENKIEVTLDKWFLESVIAGALVALIIDWVDEDLPNEPSFMADQMVLMLTKGIYK